PPAFEVYDPKEKENISNSASGLTGSKQYDYLLIPRQPGDYKIDKHSFSYFDPNAGKYITLTSPEYALKITGEPSKNLNLGGNATVSRQDVNPLGQDIRYIKTNVPRFKKQGGEFFASVGYYAFYTTPFLLFVGLIAMRRRNENLAADVVGAKRRRALKLARRRLSIADKHLKANDKKQFYDEVSRAMWGYLGDKLSIDMAMLSKDNVEEKLTAHAVKAETVTNLKNLINTCELALYAPVGEHGEMKKNYDLALNLIADLEDEIKK
ncbi:MAG TPA: BatD family protein, partial [Chitinophagales bacterium]|nr:BatD family protein [Chitinophagales bacterium]